MKKAFKWVLFSTLIASLGVIIALLSVFLPQYIGFAGYRTNDEENKYSYFIIYDQETIKVSKESYGEDNFYHFQVKLFNLSKQEQTFTFRFWFDCTKNEGGDSYNETRYVDRLITLPASNQFINSGEYVLGTMLSELSEYDEVKCGARVPANLFTNSGVKDPDTLYDVECTINRLGFRDINGVLTTKPDDICEVLDTTSDKMKIFDKMWQKAFDGVIISLSCTGGIIVLCLVFTIILLLPNKKKKEANEVANQVNLNEANLKQENNNSINNNQENANNENNN